MGWLFQIMPDPKRAFISKIPHDWQVGNRIMPDLKEMFAAQKIHIQIPHVWQSNNAGSKRDVCSTKDSYPNSPCLAIE